MAHHGGNAMDLTPEEWEKVLKDAGATKLPFHPLGLGATGKFPEGKLVPSDEGEIKIGITTQDGKVVIDFGKPTHWIGFTREQALAVAASLTKRANEILD